VELAQKRKRNKKRRDKGAPLLTTDYRQSQYHQRVK